MSLLVPASEDELSDTEHTAEVLGKLRSLSLSSLRSEDEAFGSDASLSRPIFDLPPEDDSDSPPMGAGDYSSLSTTANTSGMFYTPPGGAVRSGSQSRSRQNSVSSHCRGSSFGSEFGDDEASSADMFDDGGAASDYGPVPYFGRGLVRTKANDSTGSMGFDSDSDSEDTFAVSALPEYLKQHKADTNSNLLGLVAAIETALGSGVDGDAQTAASHSETVHNALRTLAKHALKLVEMAPADLSVAHVVSTVDRVRSDCLAADGTTEALVEHLVTRFFIILSPLAMFLDGMQSQRALAMIGKAKGRTLSGRRDSTSSGVYSYDPSSRPNTGAWSSTPSSPRARTATAPSSASSVTYMEIHDIGGSGELDMSGAAIFGPSGRRRSVHQGNRPRAQTSFTPSPGRSGGWLGRSGGESPGNLAALASELEAGSDHGDYDDRDDHGLGSAAEEDPAAMREARRQTRTRSSSGTILRSQIQFQLAGMNFSLTRTNSVSKRPKGSDQRRGGGGGSGSGGDSDGCEWQDGVGDDRAAASGGSRRLVAAGSHPIAIAGATAATSNSGGFLALGHDSADSLTNPDGSKRTRAHSGSPMMSGGEPSDRRPPLSPLSPLDRIANLELLLHKARSPVFGVKVKDRRYRLRKYAACFVASEFVDWLRDELGVGRREATEIGIALQARGRIHHVISNSKRQFADKHLFFRFSSGDGAKAGGAAAGVTATARQGTVAAAAGTSRPNIAGGGGGGGLESGGAVGMAQATSGGGQQGDGQVAMATGTRRRARTINSQQDEARRVFLQFTVPVEDLDGGEPAAKVGSPGATASAGPDSESGGGLFSRFAGWWFRSGTAGGQPGSGGEALASSPSPVGSSPIAMTVSTPGSGWGEGGFPSPGGGGFANGGEIPADAMMVCRICDKSVPYARLEDHSRTCIIVNKVDLKQYSVDIRLRKLVEELAPQIRARYAASSASASSDDRDGGRRVKASVSSGFEVVDDLDVLEGIASDALSLRYDDGDAIQACVTLVEHVELLCDRLSGASEVSAAFYDYALKMRGILEEKLAVLQERNIINAMAAESLLARTGTTPPGTPAAGNGLLAQTGKGHEMVPSVDDFEILKSVSSGGFGAVYLARKKNTGDLYAIKALKKADIVRKNLVDSVFAERNIMAVAENPFVVKLYYTFQSERYLYLVMEYCVGGDVANLLEAFGNFSEAMARLYIAQVVLALEYLHSRGIVHRDLKPDNFVIDARGDIKLTDFGLSRLGLMDQCDSVGLQGQLSASLTDSVTPRSSSLVVGTPDYLAPEILLGTGHGTAADWWAVGVILFEFLTGVPPFNDATIDAIFDNILNRRIEWIEGELSPAAEDLINKLLSVDPEARPDGEAVRAHAFFAGLDWDNVCDEPKIFYPNPTAETDVSYFRGTAPRNMASMKIPGSMAEDERGSVGSPSSVGSLSHSVTPKSGNDVFGNFDFKNLSALERLNVETAKRESFDGRGLGPSIAAALDGLDTAAGET